MSPTHKIYKILNKEGRIFSSKNEVFNETKFSHNDIQSSSHKPEPKNSFQSQRNSILPLALCRLPQSPYLAKQTHIIFNTNNMNPKRTMSQVEPVRPNLTLPIEQNFEPSHVPNTSPTTSSIHTPNIIIDLNPSPSWSTNSLTLKSSTESDNSFSFSHKFTSRST